MNNFSHFWDACQAGDARLVQRYARRFRSQLHDTENGLTPLQVAMMYKHFDVMQSLISYMDLCKKDQYGLTPLMFAVTQSLEAVNLLIPRSDLRQKGVPSGGTALMWAAAFPLTDKPGVQVSIVKALIPGSDLAQVDEKGRTARMCAQERGCSDVVAVFIELEKAALKTAIPGLANLSPSLQRVRL